MRQAIVESDHLAVDFGRQGRLGQPRSDVGRHVSAADFGVVFAAGTIGELNGERQCGRIGHGFLPAVGVAEYGTADDSVKL